MESALITYKYFSGNATNDSQDRDENTTLNPESKTKDVMKSNK